MKQSMPVFKHIYSPSQNKSMKILSFLGNMSSDYVILTSISYNSVHGLVYTSVLPNVNTYTYTVLSTMWNFGETQDEMVFNRYHVFYFSRMSWCFNMHNIMSFREGTKTCGIFSKFILQWNSSFPGVSMGPNGQQNPLLEMLMYRCGGNEMVSLLKTKTISETVSPVTSHCPLILICRLNVTLKLKYEI